VSGRLEGCNTPGCCGNPPIGWIKPLEPQEPDPALLELVSLILGTPHVGQQLTLF
jgi:hypothetical protein